jgi:hypothetical protein
MNNTTTQAESTTSTMTALNNPVELGGESNGVGFPAVGTSITLGLVKFDSYQQKDFDTDELKTWPDGKPMTGTIITGVAHKVEGVEVGPKDDKRTPQPGEQVTIWVESSKHFAWRDASKAAAAAGHKYEVSDLIWFGCTNTEPPKNPKHNPRKVYEAKIAKANPTEHAALIAACETSYRSTEAIAVEAPAIDPFA